MSQSTTHLSITGMGWTSCATTIAETLEDVGGGEAVTVDGGADRATIRHDIDASVEQFTAAVESAGYEALQEVCP